MVRHHPFQSIIFNPHIRLLATAAPQPNHILNDLTEESNDGYNVRIRTSPFSRLNNISNRSDVMKDVDYTAYPLDTYPNPLFKMSKDEIVGLADEDFAHLSKIKYRVIGEVDQFCLNIIEIIEENILEKPRMIRNLAVSLNLIQSEIPVNDVTLLQDMILENARSRLADNKLQSSIFEYILDPTKSATVASIKANIASIISLQKTTSKDRGIVLLNYLKCLASTGVINNSPILISTKRYAQIIRCVSPSKFMELYSYFFHVNIQSEDLTVIERLKRTLVSGTEIEKFVARSGWMNPKFHNISTYEFEEDYKQKMIQFFTIKDLHVFASSAIMRNDVVNATLYLNLLVSKFETKCNDYTKSSYYRTGDSNVSDDIQVVLKVTLDYLMTFKDVKTCLIVLKYLIKNDLKVELPTLVAIMKNLRLHGRFEDAILIMNNIELDTLTTAQTSELVDESLLLIKGRFPQSPKVFLGYVASFCEGRTTTDKDNVLHFLNDLKLLNFVYGDGELGRLINFDSIQKASVDDRLKGFQISAKSLAHIYDCILSSLRREKITPQLIVELFQSYMAAIKEIPDSSEESNSNKVHIENNDDQVIYHLISYLLRNIPHEKSPSNLIKSNHNFTTAKHIFQTFSEHSEVSGNKMSTRLIEMLVYSSLMIHDDYKFAAEVVRFSRTNRVPFTFNQIFPFINFHYRRQEFDRAKIWYDQIIHSGIRSNTMESKELWRIAREVGWETTGFTYRKWIIKKNHKAREELARIRTDPLILFGEQETEERVTEELINGDFNPHENHHMQVDDGNFNAELASLLYQIKQ
ncbi:hypothetical protein DFJ63DRAFT_333159 [Scheffersomyces coipomensis]|uniref:uncharacterized protein n=1 Tax=Scheffersomyces coipomensis TaxID=1788519 RepID=UPI00315DD62E